MTTKFCRKRLHAIIADHEWRRKKLRCAWCGALNNLQCVHWSSLDDFVGMVDASEQYEWVECPTCDAKHTEAPPWIEGPCEP